MQPKFWAVLILLFTLSATGQGPLSRQLSLNEITQNAGTIVHGQVIATRVEPHPQYPNVKTLNVTLRVIDPIYGGLGKQVTYRLFLPPRFGPPQSDYRLGQELVLFMHGESQYGLTSPVGGEQGRFRVIQTASGQLRVVNGLNNAGLFNQLGSEAKAHGRAMTATEGALSRQQAGAVSLKDFLIVVRQLAASKVTQ